MTDILPDVPQGFRGFAAGVTAVCARTCGWYASVRSDPALYGRYVDARSDPTSDVSVMCGSTSDTLRHYTHTDGDHDEGGSRVSRVMRTPCEACERAPCIAFLVTVMLVSLHWQWDGGARGEVRSSGRFAGGVACVFRHAPTTTCMYCRLYCQHWTFVLPVPQERLILTQEDERLFGVYCGLPGADHFGFPGRQEAEPKSYASVSISG